MSPAVDNPAPASPPACGSVAALLTGATGAGGVAAAPTGAPAATAGSAMAALGASAATANSATPGADLEAFLRVLASVLSASAITATTAGTAAGVPPVASAALAATLDPTSPTPPAAKSSVSSDAQKDATSEEVVQWLMQMLAPTAAASAAPAPAPAARCGSAPAATAAPGTDAAAQAFHGESDAAVTKLLDALTSATSDPAGAHAAHPDPLSAVSALAAAPASAPTHDTQPPPTAQQPLALDATIGASIAQLHAAASQLQSSAAPLATHELRSTVGSSAWVEELGGHLTLMAQQGNESASLKLTPPDLGPIEVRIAVHDSQASVWFGAAHTETRTALESALPRLRELFASQGMALADAGVFREPPRRDQPLATSSAARTEETETRVTSVSNMRLGLIDTYA